MMDPPRQRRRGQVMTHPPRHTGDGVASTTSADEILYLALDQPTEDRAAFIRTRCDGRPDLEDDVLSLLRAHERAGRFLEREDDERRLWPGDGSERDRVGPYQLLHVLGVGGMSTVFLAERADQSFEKSVAVKFIRRGMDSTELERRFRTERQVLADLEHPNIARLLDGGATDSGRPYLVMEHVDGVPIDEYCRRNRLHIRERVRLFETVCSAVQFAHQNLVVHRDLKPSNILVTQSGEVKLLDFGIAKVLEEESSRSSVDTETMHRILTPRYASPEQVKGQRITTKTDVYALGVLLYELLTGSPPYQVDGRSQDEIEHAVCETEPGRPSLVSKSSGNVVSVSGQLDDELDNIVLMALRKDPERRYATASELGQDLSNYLADLPVRARPDTVRYRASKFMRRNRALVVLGATALATLVGATIVSTAALIRSERAHDVAEKRRKTAERINTLLQEMLSSANPVVSQSREDVTVRQLLDQASVRVGTDLEEDPDIAAALLRTVGLAYKNLAMYPQAESTLTASLELLNDHDGDSEVAVTWLELGRVQTEQNALDRAETSVDRSLQIYSKLGSRSDISACRRELAEIASTRGDYEAAEQHLLASLEIERGLAADQWNGGLPDKGTENVVGAGDGPDTSAEEGRLATLNDLGVLLRRTGRFEEAASWMRESVPLAVRIYGPDHPKVGQVRNNLGWTLIQIDEKEEAEENIRAALTIYQRVYADDHPLYVSARSNLAEVLQKTGRHDEAIAIQREAVELFRSTLGPEHPYVAHAWNNLGSAQETKGDFSPALDAYTEAASVYRVAVGTEHPWFAIATYNRARMLHRLGRQGEANEAASLALEIRRRILPEDHPDIGRSVRLVATIKGED